MLIKHDCYSLTSEVEIEIERERARVTDVDMWLLTVMRGTRGDLCRTRWMRVSELWTEVEVRKEVKALAKAPTAAITIFRGIPPRCSGLAAHSIVLLPAMPACRPLPSPSPPSPAPFLLSSPQVVPHCPVDLASI